MIKKNSSIKNDLDFFSKYYTSSHSLVEENINQIYDDEVWLKHYSTRECVSNYLKVIKLLEKGVVLDIGCGNGQNIFRLTDQIKNDKRTLVGLDFSLEAVQCARKYNDKFTHLPSLRFLVGDAGNIPIKNNSIDAVSLIYVLHHTDNFEKLFAEIRRILKSGGYVFIVEISALNPITLFPRVAKNFVPNFIKSKLKEDDLYVDGMIPDVNLVNPLKMDNLLYQYGFNKIVANDSQIFLHGISTVFAIMPFLRFILPIKFIKYLCKIDSYLTKLPSLRHFCSHLIRIYIKNVPN